MNNILRHIFEIRVRYADTDKMGVVYNGNYLTFFEVGRTELMRSFGLPYTDFEKSGFLLPLVEAHVNYRNSAYYDDLLQIHSSLDRDAIGATLRFEYQIICKGVIVADGYTVHSFVNLESRKPVRPPRFFIEKLMSIENILV